MSERAELKNAGGWVRSLLAGIIAGSGVSLVSLVVFGYQVGSFTTKVELGQAQLQTQVKEVVEQAKSGQAETQEQVKNIAELAKTQIADSEGRLSEKIKMSNDNLAQVAAANQQAVAALSTLSTTVAASAERNTSQDREIDDIRRSLRDLNTTLRDLNNALRFQLPAQQPSPPR